jgi:hypothetical protein
VDIMCEHCTGLPAIHVGGSRQWVVVGHGDMPSPTTRSIPINGYTQVLNSLQALWKRQNGLRGVLWPLRQ